MDDEYIYVMKRTDAGFVIIGKRKDCTIGASFRRISIYNDKYG